MLKAQNVDLITPETVSASTAVLLSAAQEQNDMCAACGSSARLRPDNSIPVSGRRGILGKPARPSDEQYVHQPEMPQVPTVQQSAQINYKKIV